MNEKIINQYKLQIKLLTDKNIELQQKIDKANEILSKNCFEYDNCPDSVIKEIIELKEILGEKENDNK